MSKKRHSAVPAGAASATDYVRDRLANDPELAALVADNLVRMEVARQVRALRERRNLSQEQLAARVGTKQPAIARMESGRSIPRLDFVERVVRALDGRLRVQIEAT